MLRLTLHEGTIRVASHRKGSGRGASVHRDPACAEAAQRPGALARAFKQPVRWGAEAQETFSQLMVESRKQGQT
jgi:predicted RNA-binding protein YlxR (DUF448 family)